jgi:predicted enzyme related to lactoylglutathione lyase
VLVGPQDIPDTGRFTIINDPQGAMFALFEYKEKK